MTVLSRPPAGVSRCLDCSEKKINLEHFLLYGNRTSIEKGYFPITITLFTSSVSRRTVTPAGIARVRRPHRAIARGRLRTLSYVATYASARPVRRGFGCALGCASVLRATERRLELSISERTKTHLRLVKAIHYFRMRKKIEFYYLNE